VGSFLKAYFSKVMNHKESNVLEGSVILGALACLLL